MIHTGSAMDLLARHLGIVPFAWMAGADFDLPDRRMTVAELRRLPIIYQSADSFMNQFMSSMLYPEGNSRRSGTSCNSLAARVSLIMAGLGVSLMPLMTLETARAALLARQTGVLRAAVETSRPLIEGARHELALDVPEVQLVVHAVRVRDGRVAVKLEG